MKTIKILKKNEKGSMLIGVLIMMFMISSIAVAIMYRSLQGTSIITASKQGFLAYQGSDQGAEKFLNELKDLDEDISNGETVENKDAWDLRFCNQSGLVCLKGGTEITGPGQAVLSEITEVKSTSDSSNTKRSIQVPVPKRIENRLTNFKVKSCDGASTNCSSNYNNCNIEVSWDKSYYAPGGGGQNKSDGYEIRRSLNSKVDDNSGSGWQIAPPEDDSCSNCNPVAATESSFIVENDDDNIPSQYNKTYYFTAKVKNNQNYQLDSKYLADETTKTVSADQTITIGSKSCSSSASNPNVLGGRGCMPYSAAVPGLIKAKTPYNCCNGTECWEADTANNWKKSDDERCALQQCVSGDDVASPGDASSGWCGIPQSCTAGSICSEPYKTIGYCLLPKSPSSLTSFFPNTSWTKSNYVKVYQGPQNPSSGQQARCSKHNCPTAAQLAAASWCGSVPADGISWINVSTCTPASLCGEYTADVNCNLNCNSGYSPSYPDADHPNGTQCILYQKYVSCIGVLGARQQWNDGAIPDGQFLQTWDNVSNVYTPASKNATYSTTAGECCCECKPNYTWNGSSCVANTRAASCSGSLPDGNSVWITNTYTQQWDGSNWIPASSPTLTYATSGDCSYSCNSTSHWNNVNCIKNTQVHACGGSLPNYSSWYVNSGNYTRTWNAGKSDWDYSTTNTSAHEGIDDCGFQCDSGRHWNNTDCVKDKQTRVCGGSPISNSHWYDDSNYTATWSGTWSYSTTNTSAHEGIDDCGFQCDSNYHLGSSGTSCVSSCPADPTCTCDFSGSCTNIDTGYNDTRTCNTDPSCPAAPTCGPLCSIGGSCTDDGCSISDDRHCVLPVQGGRKGCTTNHHLFYPKCDCNSCADKYCVND